MFFVGLDNLLFFYANDDIERWTMTSFLTREHNNMAETIKFQRHETRHCRHVKENITHTLKKRFRIHQAK